MVAVCEPETQLAVENGTDGHMLQSFSVKNFRSLPDMTLDGLGTINIIVGDNGSGKTALLESMFLGLGGVPDIVLRLRAWRGLGHVVTITQSRSSYEAIWKDLFFQFDQKKTIEITSSGNPEQNRSLSIYYSPDEILPIPIGESDTGIGTGSGSGSQKADSSAVVPIIFQFTIPGSPPQVIRMKPVIRQGNVQSGAPMLPPSLVSFYCSSFVSVIPPREIADQFSDLNKRNKASDFIEAMKNLYPSITDFSVETETGGEVYLYCAIRDVAERIPIGLASSGSHKMAAILLGIAQNPRGVVLIDEIENGIYYEKMEEIWKTILKFCKELQVQVFATTHSMECLRAALPAIESSTTAFRLIRMEKHESGSVARIFRGRELAAAIKTETEIR